MIWPPDSPWSPWWRTNDKTIRKAFKLAGLKSSDTVYDLGSGDGKTLIIAAREFGARAVGIEIDPLRFYISKFIIWLSGLSDKIEVRRENFLKTDISDANVVFLYLVPKALNKLLPKLNNLKRGSRIICIKYQIDLPLIRKEVQTGREIRLYRTSKK